MTKVLLDTDKAAVIEAVSGATVTDAGTPASDDKVLIQDTSDSDNLKYVNISDLPGGGVDVLSNVATDSIIGRTTAGSGDSEELTASATRTFLNVADGATADQDLSGLATKANVLELDNTTSFTPDADYEPATKKYVDDNAGGGSGGITWNEVTGTTQAASVNAGYIANNAALVTITIPTTAAVGDVVRVTGKGAGGWKIAQNASEIIHFLGTDTTTGTGGSLASTGTYDGVEIVCVVANTEWVVASSMGNITIV